MKKINLSGNNVSEAVMKPVEDNENSPELNDLKEHKYIHGLFME